VWTIICLHPLLGSDEVGPESWQLIPAIHNEGDCLALCDTDKIMSYDHTHSFVSGLVLCFVVTAQSHLSINLGWVAWINSCQSALFRSVFHLLPKLMSRTLINLYNAKSQRVYMPKWGHFWGGCRDGQCNPSSKIPVHLSSSFPCESISGLNWRLAKDQKKVKFEVHHLTP
jgi:hypothetical protein